MTEQDKEIKKLKKKLAEANDKVISLEHEVNILRQEIQVLKCQR